jgi:hypothetical protein
MTYRPSALICGTPGCYRPAIAVNVARGIDLPYCKEHDPRPVIIISLSEYDHIRRSRDDLLEACHAIAKAEGIGGISFNQAMKAIQMARAAIARAEGPTAASGCRSATGP